MMSLATETIPISIVGMACRFPGAPDLRTFWTMLRDGHEAPTTWLPTVDAPTPYKPIERVTGIDWRLLRISPKEASRLDPQQRLLLEVAWEAFDDAGIRKRELAGTRTAVALGAMWADYLQYLLNEPDKSDGYAISGGTLAFLAARLSHAFDLRGSAEVVDAACCSSAVALASACRSLRLGEADLALVGGVNLILRSGGSLLMHRAELLSAKGQCRPLDEEADGLVRGEGAGLVVLKRAADVRPHERVYAEILGHAVAQSGRQNWIMAPAPEVQANVIAEALKGAHIAGSSVAYVEMSCPGFGRGDDVELRALDRGLGERQGQPCRVGSVKSNLGNLEGAASVAALIKVGLSLHHATWAPTLGLKTPNRALRDCAARVVAQTTALPIENAPRVFAGLTCVSYSGSNAHFVLGKAPVDDAFTSDSSEEHHLLCLSSATVDGLERLVSSYREWLARPPTSKHWLRDLCFTASCRRDLFRFRCWAVGCDAEELADALARATQRQSGELLTITILPPREFAPERGYWAAMLAMTGMQEWFEAQSAGERAAIAEGSGARRAGAVAAAGARWFLASALPPGASDLRIADDAASPESWPTLVLPSGDTLPLNFADSAGLKSTLGQLFALGADLDLARCRVVGKVTSTPAFVWNREDIVVALSSEEPKAGQATSRAPVEAPGASGRGSLNSLRGATRRLYLNQIVLNTGREVLGLPRDEQPSPRTALFDLGFTSLSMSQLRSELEAQLGVAISVVQLLGCKNLAEVVSLLV